MLKLYKIEPSQILYWETWDNDDDTHTVHWGELGSQGESTDIRSSLFKKAESKTQAEIDRLVAEGYHPINIEEHRTLLIEYEIDGFGDSQDLDKRHQLEERMNETLGWTGLGLCDGGSAGSGTMEVCSYVVSFDVAREVIATDLKDTEFDDYSRIYDEEESHSA